MPTTKRYSLLVLMNGASKLVTNVPTMMTLVKMVYILRKLVPVDQRYTLTTGVIFSSDVSKLVTNTLPLLLQLLGGISKLAINTSATTVLQLVSVN